MSKTQLIIAASSPATANSRTLADTVLAFNVLRGSAVHLAERLDSGGAPSVQAAIVSGEIEPALGNRPGVTPRGGHGVTVRYASGWLRTVRCD